MQDTESGIKAVIRAMSGPRIHSSSVISVYGILCGMCLFPIIAGPSSLELCCPLPRYSGLLRSYPNIGVKAVRKQCSFQEDSNTIWYSSFAEH